jgi:uncharacterized repeat protein (TIGR01451 family)
MYNLAELNAIAMAEEIYAGATIAEVFARWGIQVIAPRDPNEKVSIKGVGTQHAIDPIGSLHYTIYFENVSTASAAAQEVIVTDLLDSDLQWPTFQPIEFSFGDQVLATSAATGGYSTRLTIPDYRPGVAKTWWLDITADIDYASGQVTWTFRTLDPATGELPDDPLAGFLPPNDASGRGEGHVSFTIRPKADSPIGTVVTNKATITFDQEASITTNEVFNTLGFLMYLPRISK